MKNWPEVCLGGAVLVLIPLIDYFFSKHPLSARFFAGVMVIGVLSFCYSELKRYIKNKKKGEKSEG